MRRILHTIIVVLTLMTTGCLREEPVDIDVNAKCAIVEELNNGLILFEKNVDLRFPPASTAKVMTAVVAIENNNGITDIVPSKHAIETEPTVAGLHPDVSYKLDDLILAILVKSANDAAIAIAESIAGSEEKFSELMNIKAKELGMNDTYFATASGLPTEKKDSQYTTARDLVALMRYAAQYEKILDAMSYKEILIYGSDSEAIKLRTHNKTLFRYQGAPWGKTGYTREARRTFIGINPSTSPSIAFSVLQSSSLWKDITMLNEQGLKIYEQNHQNFISDLITWIRSQRQSRI